MKEGLLQVRYMQLYHFLDSFVLPVVRHHTGVALFVFWCCLVGDLLISVCWFCLIAVPRIMIWVSANVAILF